MASSGAGGDVAAGGARRAALDAVAASGLVLRAGPLSRRDLIADLATARFAGELTARTNDQTRDLRLGTGVDTVAAVEQPLTATIDTTDTTMTTAASTLEPAGDPDTVSPSDWLL